MVPANMLMAQAVAAQGDHRGERDSETLSRGRNTRKKPGYLAGVCEGEDELVDYAVDADGAGDEGERCVRGVAKDEVMCVEGCEAVFADSAAVSGESVVQLCRLWGSKRKGSTYVIVGMWLT